MTLNKFQCIRNVFSLGTVSRRQKSCWRWVWIYHGINQN